MPLVANQTLFEYRILRVLSQSAFGTLYLAHDTLLDRRVAIKELKVSANREGTAYQRFLEEARAAGGLAHPHIVKLVALHEVASSVYLVTEHLAGGSLRERLERRGALPAVEVVRIAADVCEGLAAAHAKGIVHRDVKPESIMLAENGQSKVGDFGIAHLRRDAGSTVSWQFTGTGVQPETLWSMSPEQVRGEDVDAQSDVYQVGALMFEMLTGHHYVDLEALGRQAQEAAGSNVLLLEARMFALLEQVISDEDIEEMCQAPPGTPGWVSGAAAVALSKRPEDRPTVEELAQVLREHGFDDTTVAGEARRHCQLGLEFEEQEQTEDAIREYRAALLADPGCAEAHLSLGIVFEDQGRLDKAVEEYEATLEVDPSSGEAHHCLAQVHRKRGDLPAAVRELAAGAALGYEPSSNLLKYMTSRAFAEMPQLPEPEEAPEERSNGALAGEGRATPRLSLDDAGAHAHLGMHYGVLGRLDEAIDDFQVALSAEPDDAGSHLQVGATYAVQGHWEEAAGAYRAALQLEPNSAEAHYGLGVAYRELGRVDDAIAACQAALQANPNMVEAHHSLGVAYGAQGRWDEAIPAFQSALSLDPDHAEAHVNLGLAYGHQGRWEEAISEFEVALRINPKDARAHYNLGVAYGQQGRVDDAIREYQAALKLNARHTRAHNNLGVAYLERGQPEDAVREFEAAVRLGPLDAGAQRNLDAAYAAQRSAWAASEHRTFCLSCDEVISVVGPRLGAKVVCRECSAEWVVVSVDPFEVGLLPEKEPDGDRWDDED